MKCVLQGINFASLKEWKFPKIVIWKTVLQNLQDFLLTKV